MFVCFSTPAVKWQWIFSIYVQKWVKWVSCTDFLSLFDKNKVNLISSIKAEAFSKKRTERSWATFSKGCPNFWHILYMYADIDLSVSPQQDRRLIRRPALRFSPANHMDVYIAFIQTNKQITLQMVIGMHINQLCLLNKKVFKLTCQDILHLKFSCSVYALLLKVMVKVTLHSVDEIRQVCCVIWFSSLLLTKLSLDSTNISSANNKSETSLTQWKLI